MLKSSGSESESSVETSDSEVPQPRYRPTFRAPILRMQTDQGPAELAQLLEERAAQERELQAQQLRLQQQTQLVEAESRQAEEQARAMAEAREWAKLQAVTSANVMRDIGTIDRFTGEVGDLNHFIRSVDGVHKRINERLSAGRLDALDAETLKTVLVRRVHRRILNRLQVEETTPWEEVRGRLQKEYGGGRWTPDEDALQLLRMRRGPGQSKGEFAAQLLRHYNAMADKYREVMTGPAATAKLEVIEGLVKIQLEEAVGAALTGTVVEEANRLIDAAERDVGRTRSPRTSKEWTWGREQRQRRPEMRAGRDPDRRNEAPRDRPKARQVQGRSSDDRKCYGCGKRGHIQARCPRAECYRCGGVGHFARACSHAKPQRQDRGEPMEINHHGPPPRVKGRKEGARVTSPVSETGYRTQDEDSTTDSEGTLSTYAAALRRSQPKSDPRPERA